MKHSKSICTLLDNALSKAVAKGWTPTRGQTVNPTTKQCCAIGAAFIDHPYKYRPSTIQLGNALGLARGEAWTLAAGFDGGSYLIEHSVPETPRLRNLYRVGMKLAKKWIKQ